jgi:DUF4097 and DUF4098 domain-containing protein YvlB
MSTFDSPGPVAISLTLLMGNVRIVASDRTDTVVGVRPAGDSAKARKAAEQTTVDFRDGRLTVRTPKDLASLFGKPGGVDVDIEVPTGSSLDGDTGLGDLVVEGRLGACKFKTGLGALHLGDTGRLDLVTGFGEVSVVDVDGDAEVSTGMGSLRLGRIAGTATVKNSNGAIQVAEVARSARLVSSNGEIQVDRVLGALVAKTAWGAIRVREAVRGDIEVQTAFGELEIGIPEGTAAWLELDAAGGVHNLLGEAAGPAETDEQVKIRARTRFGDIVIRRSHG